MKKMSIKKILPSIVCIGFTNIASADNVVTQWNDVALGAVRSSRPGPTVTARALAITNTCMYDAWSVYDEKALSTQPAQRQPASEFTDANKVKAISFAAYRCLNNLFPSQSASFDIEMGKLGFSPSDTSTVATIANSAAFAVLASRSNDGANQNNGYKDTTGYQPKNSSTSVNDPNHWQSLQLNGVAQSFTTPHWGLVKPYALSSGSQFRSLLKLPADYTSNDGRYLAQAKQVLDYSANLTDEKKVIAEFWADGPSSETPPGHWVLFAKEVSVRDGHTIDQDVKMFFALTNADFDASIAAWDAKRAFDYVRPITAINYLFAGQSVKSWEGTIDGANWKPYQVSTAPTPPFPEYVSGHSTFSGAAAETLKLFTKSDNFGYSSTISAGSSTVEPGLIPQKNTTLYWPTFSDAASEAGVSRRFGGIHFIDADLEGRKLGMLVGQQAWDKSLMYFNDTALGGNYYDDTSKKLILEDVLVDGKHVSVTLINTGNAFSITASNPFTKEISTSVVQYDSTNGLVNIPKLIFNGKLYKVVLKQESGGLFRLTSSTVLN